MGPYADSDADIATIGNSTLHVETAATLQILAECLPYEFEGIAATKEDQNLDTMTSSE